MDKTDNFLGKYISHQDIQMFKESMNHFFMGIHYHCFDTIFPNRRKNMSTSHIEASCKDDIKFQLEQEFILYRENILLFSHRLLFWAGFHFAQQGGSDLHAYFDKLQFESTLIQSPGYQALQKKIRQLFFLLKSKCTKGEMVQILERTKQNRYSHPKFKRLMFQKGYLFYHYFQEIYEGPSPLFPDLKLEELLEMLPY